MCAGEAEGANLLRFEHSVTSDTYSWLIRWLIIAMNNPSLILNEFLLPILQFEARTTYVRE